MQAHEQIRATTVRNRRAHGQINKRVRAARENHLETKFLELVAHFKRQRQRVIFFVMKADAVARIFSAVAWVEADGRDFFLLNVMRRRQQRTDCRVQIKLRDECAGPVLRRRKRQPHIHSVDFRLRRIHAKHQTRSPVGEDNFIVRGPDNSKTIRTRPVRQRRIILAVDESRARRPRAKRETNQNQRQKFSVHAAFTTSPAWPSTLPLAGAADPPRRRPARDGRSSTSGSPPSQARTGL